MGDIDLNNINVYHLPINRNTDYDVTGQKQAKDSEEGTDTT